MLDIGAYHPILRLVINFQCSPARFLDSGHRVTSHGKSHEIGLPDDMPSGLLTSTILLSSFLEYPAWLWHATAAKPSIAREDFAYSVS